jgi:thiamine phosphate synthase YjbQ (UPF0047 family)
LARTRVNFGDSKKINLTVWSQHTTATVRRMSQELEEHLEEQLEEHLEEQLEECRKS